MRFAVYDNRRCKVSWLHDCSSGKTTVMSRGQKPSAPGNEKMTVQDRDFDLRKLVTYFEDIYMECGKPGGPVRVCAVAAVISNPWAGKGFVDDLQPEILRIAPQLAVQISSPLVELCGGPDKVAAFGKAAIVGSEGEGEHAAALIPTLRFG